VAEFNVLKPFGEIGWDNVGTMLGQSWDNETDQKVEFNGYKPYEFFGWDNVGTMLGQ